MVFFKTKPPANTKLDILAIADKIKDEKSWCRRALARDEFGDQLFSSGDPCAVSFCLLGAAAEVIGSVETLGYLHDNVKSMGYTDLAKFNDDKTQTHEQIMVFLKLNYIKLGGNLKEWEKKIGNVRD